jgi:hypothetical protein
MALGGMWSRMGPSPRPMGRHTPLLRHLDSGRNHRLPAGSLPTTAVQRQHRGETTRGHGRAAPVEWGGPSRCSTKCASCGARIRKGQFCGSLAGTTGAVCAECLTSGMARVVTRRIGPVRGALGRSRPGPTCRRGFGITVSLFETQLSPTQPRSAFGTRFRRSAAHQALAHWGCRRGFFRGGIPGTGTTNGEWV